MVGAVHCPMISKYGPSLSKAVGPVDPSILGVKKSHCNKTFILSTNSTKQKVHVCCQYSKTCQKQPLKKDKTKILKINGSFNEGHMDCRMLPMEHSAILSTALSDNWSFLTGRLRQVLLHDQQSICIQVSV